MERGIFKFRKIRKEVANLLLKGIEKLAIVNVMDVDMIEKRCKALK